LVSASSCCYGDKGDREKLFILVALININDASVNEILICQDYNFVSYLSHM